MNFGKCFRSLPPGAGTTIFFLLWSPSPVAAQVRRSASRTEGGGSGETLVIVLVIGGVLLFAAVLAFFLIKRGNAKYAKLWPGLSNVIGGTFSGHKMSGMYNNLPVNARVHVVGSARRNEYRFEISAASGSGGDNWIIWYDITLSGGQWRVRANDDLNRRLNESGAVAEMQRHEQVLQAEYRAGAGTLTYSARIANAYALPSPEQFKSQLDFLMYLIQINHQVNAG